MKKTIILNKSVLLLRFSEYIDLLADKQVTKPLYLTDYI